MATSGGLTSPIKGRNRNLYGDGFPAVLGSLPTFAMSAAGAATSIASGTDYPMVSGSALTTTVTRLGRFLVNSPYAQPNSIGVGSTSGVLPAGNTLQTQFPNSPGQNGFGRYEFFTDASQLEVVFFGEGSPYNVRINGGYATSGARTDLPSNVNFYRLLISSLPANAYNRITVEGNNCMISTIRVPIANGVWPADYEGPKMVVVGDSYMVANTLVTADYATGGGIAQNIGYTLGIPNTVPQGLGGTGLVATNGSTRATYLGRVGDLIAEGADIVWLWGSVNDATLSGVGSQCSQWITAARAGLPNALFFATSPPDMVGNGTQATNLAANVEGPMSTACAAAGVPFMNLRLNAPMTGTGNVGAPAGNGNRDRYTAADVVHPTRAGMMYIAGCVQPLIDQLLQGTQWG